MHEKEVLDRKRKKMGNYKNMPKKGRNRLLLRVEEGREG